ncbi:hypothetical protein TruAng_009986 [Truncatella angustata]|nr:hypothetical protein TruAng_009986 [Truncatella angustata]
MAEYKSQVLMSQAIYVMADTDDNLLGQSVAMNATASAAVSEEQAGAVTNLADDQTEEGAASIGDMSNSTAITEPIAMEAPKKKKKKRNNRPGKTRRAITGFEEFYADSPTTPAEHLEEKSLYSRDKSFVERIEQAVQRYRQSRRFDNQRSHLFDKYLALGGIESCQRMFQGLDAEDAKTMTNDEIRAMKARDVIHYGFGGSKFYDSSDPGDWTIDFPIIVKGFLLRSRWVPENYPRSDEGYLQDMEQAGNFIHNFLNYLQMHDVCPEYNEQLLVAKSVCVIAPVESRYSRELFRDLQDSFNTAAKFLFCDGGVFETNKDSPIDSTTAVETPGRCLSRDPADRFRKLDPFTQLIIFRLTVMDITKNIEHLAVGDDPRNIRIESTKTETYQVVSVGRRKKKEKAMLEKLLAEQGLSGKVMPAGTMILRPNMIEHAYSNMPRPDEFDWTNKPTEKFIMDDDILEKVQPGMKMQLVVCQLNVGITFIKKVLDVRPTFDTILPQSLMLTWKDPVTNERPAPSVDKPASEENADGSADIEIEV